MSTNRKIARASAILIGAGACGHVLGLAKEIMVANYFGITYAMDAFYAAITLPNVFNYVLLSTFGAVFIPTFMRYRLLDKDQANHIAAVITNYLSLLLFIASALLFIFAPSVINIIFHGLSPKAVPVAVTMLRILCVTVILSGLIGMLSGILRAHDHFSAPALSQICITASTILFILFLSYRAGVFVLAYGMVAGLTIQLFILVPLVLRKGYHHFVSMKRDHPAVREMFYLSLLYLVSIIAWQMNVVVDRVMASYLSVGSIAALGYADKLIQAPIVIFSAAIAASVFPFFSAQAPQGRVEEMSDSVSKSIRMSGFIFFPMTVILCAVAHPLIQILFERGAFGYYATDLTTVIFICYSLQLFFFTVGLIAARVYLVFRQMKALIWLSFIGVALNVALNLAFIKLLIPPAAGIALATSVVYLILAWLLLALIGRRMLVLRWDYIRSGLERTAICAVVAGIAALGVLRLSRASDLSAPILARAAWLAAAMGSGAGVFALLSLALGLEEPRMLRELIRRDEAG